ncbi:Zinc finger protein 91-like 1, partial [Homarus americanus]
MITIILFAGVNGVTSHHLVEADDDGVGVVDTMDGENDTLKVTSMMTHDGAHSIDHTSLQDEVHYVTTDESGHAVTVVYPQSALPLLRTSDGSLVNFVELPGVHGELGLDQGELGGEAGMVLQQDFTGEGPITVVTADDTGEQLALLDQQHGHSGVTMTGGEGGQSITYLTAAEDTADGSPSAILGEQLIQIPASDQSGSTHTITLPLSFLNDGTGVSILQGLGHLQLPLVGETGGDSITLTSPVDSDNIASVGGADVSHSRVLSVLQSSAVPTTASGTFSVITSQSTIQNDHNELSSASQIHVPISTSRPHNSSSTKPFVFKTSSHVSGKQNSSHQPRKLIGSGPLAISAQGFVQKIGNRMVTVLPRPEDLKKLRESKSLILSIKGSGDSDAYGSKSSRARKVPVPVRPHQRYGRRGRGGGRGRPPSVSRAEVKVDKEQIAKTVSLLKKEVPGDSILLAETSGDHHLDGFIKLEDSTSEGIVVDMTLPGGSPASAVLVKGPPEDEEFILSNIDPPTPVMSRRGRRKKRGRGRPRGTYVISSSGRRPGRPKKVETLLEGPHGARMIHTGPDTRLDGELDHQENELVETVPTIELAGEEGSDGLQELRVLEMGALKQEPIDIEIKKEEEVDPNRRKLPPRRRGARYEKMIQALKKRENDDDDFSMGEEEDISPDYLTYRRPPPPPKTRGTSGPGKRGRPRKHWPPPPVIKVEPGTEQHLLGGPLDASHMTQVTARDLVTSMTEGDLTEAEKHNLLITFQRPETGEVVITMLPPPPAAQQQDDFQDHTTTEGTQTEEDIELPTGFVTSSGLNRHRKVHKRSSNPVEGLDNELKCTVCQANFTYKRTLTKHMSTVHGDGILVKEENESVVKSFPSEVSIVEQLQEQLNEGYAPKTSELYDEPKQSETLESKFPVNPFKCGICEESFTDVDVLCDHYTNSHTGDQEVYCDVCSVGCATDQQLEQHKQLHLFEEQQSMIHTIPTEEFPFVCPVCGKSFRKHQEFVRHHRAHTHEKSYKCELCGAGFPLKSALDKHVLVHTGERPFKCDICLKSFRQSAALVRHKLWTHRLKNQNKCELCGKTFFTPALLSYHLDSHGDAGQSVKSRLAETSETEEQQLLEQCHSVKQENRGGGEVYGDARGDGQHGCEYCGKNFSSYVLLLTHKLTHKLSASYKCDVCHRTFREKRYLQKHKLTHKGVKSWKCDICKKAFATKLTLIRHSHVHLREALRPGPELPFIPEEGEDGGEIITGSTLPAVLKCDECGIDFAHKSHFVRHKLLHSDGSVEAHLYMCEVCGRVFDKKKYLYTHHNVHSRQRNFPCTYCGKQLASRLALKNHHLIHTGEMPFKCSQCDKEFRSSSNLKRHERSHPVQDVNALRCDECDESFYSPELLNQHKASHMQGMMMMNPGVESVTTADNSHHLYVFETVGEVGEAMDSTQQLLVDNSQQQFLVDGSQPLLVFPEAANTPYSELTEAPDPEQEEAEVEHVPPPEVIMVHEKMDEREEEEERVVEKPFRCDDCGKSFAKKQYLTKHKYRHREVKPHACDVCGKRFAQKFEVAVHKIKHTGERPHKCDVCHKPFRSKVNLLNHKMRHTGEYPFLCSVCSKGFSTQLQLERHVTLHTGSHPYKCSICQRGYTQRTTLIKHLAKAHDILDVSQIEAMDSLENVEAVENMESMEEVEGVEKSMFSNVHETAMEVNEQATVEEDEHTAITMDTDILAHGEQQAAYSVVEVHPDYLKDYLMAGPQVVATHDMDPKLLQSILQQVRNSQDETDGQAVVHVNAIDG